MALSFGAIVVHTAIIICGKIWNKYILCIFAGTNYILNYLKTIHYEENLDVIGMHGSVLCNVRRLRQWWRHRN